jgi:hypothetical protein
VTFSVSATGSSSLSYQWRKNGALIIGATNPTLSLPGVTSNDAGNYDVVVSNGLGSVNSSVAILTVVGSPVAPVITAQPANKAVLAGSPVTLSVGATGAPSPSYQWRKNGGNIPGANGPTLTFAAASSGDAGTYDVVIGNSVGSVTSAAANLRVITHIYAGYYFGSFSGGQGTFALLVREDNTGVFLGYLPNNTAPVVDLAILVNDSGQFVFSQAAVLSGGEVSAASGDPARAAALPTVIVNGTIASDGSLSGVMSGGASANLAGTRTSGTATAGIAGFYQAGAVNGGATMLTIAGPNSQAFAITQSGTASDGGTGTVGATGQVSVLTSRSVMSETLDGDAGLATGTSSGAINATFTGGSETANARQRLVNISSRARVATGDAVAIAGFVIAGEESKTVLIRAVGPTIGAAPFNVGGALASPRLELFRGSQSLAINAGIATNRLAIDAAGQQAGAFALGASGADAAILTTLAPGAYTAVVSSNTNTAGVALVEVYDLSGVAPGQKLLNIATRAAAGTSDATLIAGFVIPPGAPKRVLVRGVGPGLAAFGVSGTLAQPILTLLSGSTTVATNTNFAVSPDATAIRDASARVGAFAMTNNDSAVIVTLAPGNYTAQVLGAGGTTGVALIEVYELP